MTNKYYAVVSGRVPGIYNNWPAVESMVKGFPGAIFKSFKTKIEAENFINRSTTINGTKQIPLTLPLVDKTIVYTDGSYANKECGFGIVIIASNGDKITAYGKVPLNPSNNVGELYAIYVALSLVSGDMILYTDSQYSISCLTSYIHDWLENGWNNASNRDIIEPCYNLMKNRNVILQYVPGHSNIQLNEEADKLANQGRLSLDPLVIIKNGIRQNIPI